MGVHGLATYLRENQRKLSTPLVLSQERSRSEATIPLVVDGWSFIYELYNQSRLPWVYGGEPLEFRDLVTRIARAWISVGLRPYFVFDGPYHQSKFATSTIRAEQSTIQPSILFFRTSPLSRAAPRFLRENSILPPFYYVATLDALRSLDGAVQIYMADNEGDPFAVELAGRLRGYVTGRDSDYVILNVEGYAGYIPMDQMVWSTDSQGKEEEGQTQDDAGFVVSQRNKVKKRGSELHAQGIISPDTNTNDALSLSCVVYSPHGLAAHLQISLSLLPLLAALVGNDFTADRRSTNKLFYERNMTTSQRITRVANALKSVAAAASGKSPKKARRQITSVVDFVDLTIESLLIRPVAMGSGEREGIVEKTVDAALRYAIPKNQDGDQKIKEPTSACALHDAKSCPLVGFLSRPASDLPAEDENGSWERVRSLYISAYRRGDFSPGLMDILSTRTAWPELFLENPDVETVIRSLGRPIREWVYALLDDGTGLLGGDTDTEGSGLEESTASEESDDEDEVIGVHSDSDSDEDMGTVNPLVPLQGALEKLSTGTTIPPLTSSVAPTSPKHVIEHVRRGTRHVEEPVSVPTLATLLSAHSVDFAKGPEPLPVQLWDEELRLTVFLRALGSDTPLVKALPPEQLMTAVSLKWIVRRLADRADEAGPSAERQREKWTIREGQAFLASFSWPCSPNGSTSDEPAVPPLEDRNIQLTAQVLATFDAVEMLSQTLLLTSRVPNRAYLFSGKAFHRCLSGNGEHMDARIPSGLWDACVGGSAETFAHGEEGSTKKNRKSKGDRARLANAPALQGTRGQSIFDVLSSLGEVS